MEAICSTAEQKKPKEKGREENSSEQSFSRLPSPPQTNTQQTQGKFSRHQNSFTNIYSGLRSICTASVGLK